MSGTRGGRGRIVAMGLGLALALLLLAAGEARAGKYAVAQCGWHLGADAGLGRHDRRREVPARLLLRDAGRGRPLRRRPPEELHPRRAADRLRHPFRPLALDDARRAPASRQVRGTWWHALHDGFEQRLGDRHRGRRLRALRRGRRDRRRPARLRRRLLARRSAAFEDRLLCARAESKSCSLDPGSWSGDAGADDHGRGRRARRPARSAATSPAAAGCAGRRGCRLWGADIGAGVRFGETHIDGARVALTEYPCAKALDRRRMAGDARCAPATRRRRRRRRSPPAASATAPTSSATA